MVFFDSFSLDVIPCMCTIHILFRYPRIEELSGSVIEDDVERLNLASDPFLHQVAVTTSTNPTIGLPAALVYQDMSTAVPAQPP
jgi:hypothetical protein